MNYAIAQDHVPEIDRASRTIKEIFRALYHRLPYNATPELMVRYGVKDVTK